jgi:hypothetical protein
MDDGQLSEHRAQPTDLKLFEDLFLKNKLPIHFT